MKELIQKELAELKIRKDKYNRLREFLHELALQFLDRQKQFRHLAFVGGTAY